MANSFSLWNILAVLIGSYVFLAAYIYFSQNSQVFHPPKGHTDNPANWGLEYETVLLNSEGHTLTNWWIPGDSTKPVVLFFHGNATNISELYSHVQLFSALGMGIFLLDYRGYGLSEGQPSEFGTYADGQAAWFYLVEKKAVLPADIIFYGHSLGGAVAAGVAANFPPGSMILEGTFTSVPDVGAEIYPYLPVRLMSHIKYPTLERIGHFAFPILIIHSQDDAVIPVHHGEKLFAAATEPKQFYRSHGGHHNGFANGGVVATAVLKDFLKLEH